MENNMNVHDPNDAPEIFTFWKGRVALYAILKALDLGPGDAVLMPGYTCMVVPAAVKLLGGRPVYADVEEKSYNLSQKTLEAAWRRSNGSRPKAVIIQHTYGIPVEADPILEWARREELTVIEDCAHVLGSSYRGVSCGQLGDFAFFSSQWNKPITTGLGGWAVANSSLMARRLRQVAAGMPKPGLVQTFRLAMQFYAHRLLFRPKFYWPLMSLYRALSENGMTIGSSSAEEMSLGSPRRYALGMSDFQENLLRRRLAQSAANISHRRRLADFYAESLAATGLEAPQAPENSQAVLVRYPVRVKDKTQKLSLAQENRLEVGDWFVSPLHPLLDNWERLDYRAGSCPMAEDLCHTVVNLPTHPRVTPGEALKIASLVLGN